MTSLATSLASEGFTSGLGHKKHNIKSSIFLTPQDSDKYSHPGPVIKCSGSNAPDISKCGDRPEGITLSAKAIEYLLITRLETVNQQYHSAWLRYGATTTKTTKRGNNKKKYK